MTKNITIWHNPKCGTSRTVLAALRDAGQDPNILLYLETPPDAATLARVAKALGGARNLLRTRGTPAADLGLETADDATILAAMAKNPVLIERPVVITPTVTILARPAERVQEVLT